MYAGLRGLGAVVYEAEAFGGQLINLYPTKPVSNFPAQPRCRRGSSPCASQSRPSSSAPNSGSGVRSRTSRPGKGGFKIDGSLRQDDAKTLVLALGLGRFTPRRLGLEDEERFLGKGLAYRLPPLEEVRAKRAVVVGGGDTALDTALSLREVAEVTVVRRRDEFRAFAHTQDRFAGAGIEVVSNGEVVGLKGRERLESVVVRAARRTVARSARRPGTPSIGQVPDLSGFDHWGLGLTGSKIDVDSAMETSLPGVYAVGDFAAYPGKVRMIATAVAEGSTAAAAAQRYLSAS